MSNGAGNPKPAFFIAVLAVVAGLCGLAFYRCNSSKKTTGGDTAFVRPGGPVA